MSAILRNVTAASLVTVLLAPTALAANWQNQLASAISQTGTKPGAGTLSSLLAGGPTTLAANSMPNVAGIFEYCVKQKLVKVTDPESIKNKLRDKIGLTTTQEQKEKPGYQEGLSGLLNTREGQQLNFNTLNKSALGQKVKLKACDIILNQSLSYIAS